MIHGYCTVFSPCTMTLFSLLATTATWLCFPLSLPQRTSTCIHFWLSAFQLEYLCHSCMCGDGLRLTKSPRTIFHFVMGSGGFRLCPFMCLRRAAAAVHGRQDIVLLVAFPGRCIRWVLVSFPDPAESADYFIFQAQCTLVVHPKTCGESLTYIYTSSMCS